MMSLMKKRVSQQAKKGAVVAFALGALLLLVSRAKSPPCQHALSGLHTTQSAHTHAAASLLDVPGVRNYRRLRLVKLQLNAQLASLWMATPDWEDPKHAHYGAEWYKQAWDTSKFNYDERVCGQLCVERIVGAVPCTDGAMVFQAGSHLGIFPFIGMALGCQGLAMEGNPTHIPFMQLNAALNGFQQRFRVINSIVGREDNAQGLSFAGQAIVSSNTPGSFHVPMRSIDSVFKEFYPAGQQVSLGIVDVEGHEQQVLLGASNLIKSRAVAVWVIEVWFRQNSQNTSQPLGLQLLLDSGYKLYNVDLKPQTSVGAEAIKRILDGYCATRHARAGADGCLMDWVAVRPDVEQRVIAAL